MYKDLTGIQFNFINGTFMLMSKTELDSLKEETRKQIEDVLTKVYLELTSEAKV